MCFSPEASFTVGSVLSAGGLAVVKKYRKTSFFLLSLIPLMFGIQQISEGIVWVYIDKETVDQICSEGSKYLYLLFAWVIWPLFIPIAIFVPENVAWKKWLIGACWLLGAFIAYQNIIYLTSEEVVPQVVGSSIFYGRASVFDDIAYAVATITPTFISSIKNMWLLGVLILAAFIGVELVYFMTFTSVWCFFAAVVSIVLIQILNNAKNP